ncbi:unnamed protein product [Lupinus luteus]|uniref:Uncharacterized protein n=1 Tax=Lupinus luteus TaxID=3873 RepID=A0AAV1WZ16_LUPLU
MARSEHKPGTGIHTASTRQVAQADSLADVLMRPALNQAPGQVSKHQAKSESFDHLKSDFKSKQLVSKHITNNSLKLVSRLRSRSLTELTRQIAPPTKNGHAPPPIESRKSSQSVNPYYVWTCAGGTTRPVKARSASPAEGTSRPVHTNGGPIDPTQVKTSV